MSLIVDSKIIEPEKEIDELMHWLGSLNFLFNCSKLTIETLEEGVNISKLTIKTPEQRSYFTPCSSVSIVNFENAVTGCLIKAGSYL